MDGSNHRISYIDLLSSQSEEEKQPIRNQQEDVFALTNQTKSMSIKNVSKATKKDAYICHPTTLKKNLFSYEDVCGFNILKETSSISQNYFILKDYIQQSIKNILFVFGPSGCGKTLMVTSALIQNNIPYQFAGSKVEDTEQGQVHYEDNIDTLQRLFASNNMIQQQVYLFKEFPIACAQSSSTYSRKQKLFKQNLYEKIGNCRNRNKYIFLLNSEIYSAFSVLSENSETRAIGKLTNVSILKMEPYGMREMKQIIDHFIKIHPVYSDIVGEGRNLDEIITQANGDARKALNLIYHRKISQNAKQYAFKSTNNGYIQFYKQANNKSTHNKSASKASRSLVGDFKKGAEQKQQLKVTIFHMLGKFLYGKRANISYDPKGKKKNNQPSAYYTEEQINQLDPPFYFQPVQLLDKSNVTTHVFAELIEENFLYRYGKVKDIKKMYDMFRYYDSYLVDGMNRFQLLSQMEPNLRQLLAWAIVVYNKNSFRDKTMFKIKRSRQLAVNKIIGRKKQLLKTYFVRSPIYGKYSLRDIIRFAECLNVETSKQQYYGFYLQKLLQIVFNGSYKNESRPGGDIDSKVSIMLEQQEGGIQNCNSLNKIDSLMIKENNKIQRITKLIMEDSDQSDIESD